jgi:hypothetical protein
MLLTGCPGKSGRQIVECQAVYEPCQRPNPMRLARLDNATHIGGATNVEILMRDFNDLELFINQMNATIGCYERQAKKGN